MQLLPVEYSLAVGVALAAVGLVKRFRVLLLFGLTVFGYLFWVFAVQYLAATMPSAPILIILNRLSLVGYIIPFAVWAYIQPCSNYLKLGNMSETLKAPMIWWGKNEYVWRFVLIACIFWAIPAVIFSFMHGAIFEFMPYTLLFAIINPILEGIIWRGFILGRVVNYAGEKQGLIIVSIAFGLYHLSLGFSIWMCLLFAIGGFYMGGIAIKSKGFLAATILHFFVNLALISFGIIF